jgi:signal transduction histidine kinase
MMLDVIAAVALAVSVHDLLTGSRSASDFDSWLALAVLGGGAALVVVRRWQPGLAAIGSVVTSGLILLAPASAIVVWVLAEICLFSFALRGRKAVSVVVSVIHAVLLYVGAIVAFKVEPLDPIALILPVWTGAVVAFGHAVRSQREYVQAVEDRARSTVSKRESEAERRMTDERLRVARDLHDSVANSIAVISLHATNARRHIVDDPSRAATAMRTVEAVSRESLRELGDILRVLRQNDADQSVAVASNIPTLLSLLETPSMTIDADLSSLQGVQLEPAADAALYRVAQESFTNAQRHGTGHIRVRMFVVDGHVGIDVSNSYVGGLADREPSGFGLVGMRERVDLAGGSLTVEDDGSTFVIRALVPASVERLEPS